MSATKTAPGGLYLPGPRRFTREEFERIADSGVFPPDARLELIEGEILVRDEPMKAAHAASVRRCEKVCARLFPVGHDVRGQLPLALGGRNEPLPDIAVVVGSAEDYEHEHPASAVLVIEVADSTLRYDRTTKASLYARAGIPENCVLNLLDRTLEIHRAPEPIRGRPLGYGYSDIRAYREGELVEVMGAAGTQVPVADLLPGFA